VSTPAPAPAPAPAAPPPDSTRASSSGSTWRTLGLITGGVGIVGIGVGSAFGLVAKSKNDSTSGHCNGGVCDAPTISTLNDARTAATVSTVAFISGGALLAAGAVMYLLSPSASPATGLVVSPGAAGYVAGLTLHGGWE
jgi:hypothetical protein